MARGNIFSCTVRNSGKSAEIVAAVRKCVELGLIPDIYIWLGDDVQNSCTVCEKWSAVKIFDDHVRKLNEFDNNAQGLIITSKPAGFNELVFNMSNHASCSEILNLTAKIRPEKIVFVHGTQMLNTPRNVLREIPERFGNSINALHSINGEEINLKE